MKGGSKLPATDFFRPDASGREDATRAEQSITAGMNPHFYRAREAADRVCKGYLGRYIYLLDCQTREST